MIPLMVTMIGQLRCTRKQNCVVRAHGQGQTDPVPQGLAALPYTLQENTRQAIVIGLARVVVLARNGQPRPPRGFALADVLAGAGDSFLH